MNYKKLVTASLIFANILCVSDVFAQELQAKVAIGSNLSKKHAEIDKMIEYNKYSEADAALREVLNSSPNDVDAKALRIIWIAKQHKLAPAQEELDKMLKQYPNNAALHYAQGLVYLKRRTSSDVTYIRDSKNLLDEAIKSR